MLFDPVDAETPNRLRKLRSHGAPSVSVSSGMSKIDVLYGSGRISKEGAGTLDIGETTGYSGIRVDGGTVTVHGPARTPVAVWPEGVTPAFHLDATVGVTCDEPDAEGRRRVSKWTDRNGGSNFAEVWSDNGGSMKLPWIVEDYANGKPIVDFGNCVPYASYHDGCALKFTSVAAKEIIVVGCDSDENAYGIFFNNGGGGNYNNGRGTRGQIAVPISRTGQAASAFARGRLWLDGYPTDGQWEANGRGLHVYAYSLPDEEKAAYCTLGNERTSTVGGVKIAEIMFFTSHITDEQRADIIACLKAKWLDKSVAGHYQAQEIALTDGGTIDVADGTFRTRVLAASSGTVTKSGAGTLAADRLSPQVKKIAIKGGSVSFAGGNVADETPTLPAAPYIHLDASSPLATHFATKTDAAGRIRVTCWKDVRGDGYPTAHEWAYKSVTLPGPTYVANALNGLPVLDFGESTATANLPVDDPASTLEIAKTGNSEYFYREGFFVAAYPDTASKRGSVLGGESASYDRGFHFMPSSTAMLSSTHSSSSSRGAYWTVDGATIQPLTDNFSNGYHVFRFSGSQKFFIQAIATDRAGTIGGIKIAEMVLYSRQLTDKERIDAETYLMKKWLPEKSHPFAQGAKAAVASVEFADDVAAALGADADADVSTVVGEGAFTKTGNGALSVKTLSGSFDEIAVEAGSLAVGKITSIPSAWFHVDASDASTLTTQVVEGVTYVDRIADADGGAVAAANQYATEASGPRLVKSDKARLPYLDFGDTCDAAGVAPWLKWTSECSNIKEVVMVVGLPDKNAFYLGYQGNTYFDFHRGTSNGALLSSDFAKYKSGVPATIDAEEQDAYTYAYPAGIHVMTLTLTNAEWSCRANNFGNDRNGSRVGGLQLCEAYVFTECLTDGQRGELVGRLMKKWKDAAWDVSGAVARLQSVDVGFGTSFSVEDDLAIADNATVTAGGTVSVTGQLSLGANVSVTYDGDPVPGEYELFAAESFSGVENLGTWTLTNAIAKYPYKFVLRNGKVLLEIRKPGLLLIVK